jgi:putative methyltransferase (TIGR04325 family)
VPPYNEAVRIARGLWIAPIDDDDAFRPDHLERLLAFTRAQRLEVGYSRLCMHYGGGETTTIGRFPPEHGQFGLQSCLYHHGLASIFELELADGPLGLPYDWGMCRRMMEAGVRIGMLDEVDVDYYPSKVWTRNRTGTANAAPASPPEWEFVPEGWERVGAVRGWNAEDVAGAYREKWPAFVEAVQGSGPLGVSHEVPLGTTIGREDPLAQNAVLAYAYALARAADGTRGLSVLDWGGALGHHYLLAQALFPDVTFDYHCCELAAVCAAGREVLPDVRFHEGDECLARDYDLVIASNSLQYERDWQARLKRLGEATRGWLFLSRVPLARDHRSFVVLQRAHPYGYATEYLGWVLGRDELLGAACREGLALVREFSLLAPFTIAGAPDGVAHGGFLFRRGEPGA